MEHLNEAVMPERDLSPHMLGLCPSGNRRQKSHEDAGCGCEEAPSCSLTESCSLGWGLAKHPLAMVYAPCQGFIGLYDPDTALARGTIFSELDLPLEAVRDRGTSGCGICNTGARYHHTSGGKES